MYQSLLNDVNEKIILLIRVITKNMLETTLILDVVLGSLKLRPIVNSNVETSSTKLPIVNKILFSPS